MGPTGASWAARSFVTLFQREQGLEPSDQMDSADVVRMWWVRFVPALLVWPVWWFAVLRDPTLSVAMLQFWPMVVAMIAGSIIAGSTPLGGGVVAFPVTVLYLGFTPAQGRDYSILIQSIGMNAAAYLLLIQKRNTLQADFIVIFIIFGALGVLIGLQLEPPPYHTNLVYTTLILEFAIIYLYSKNCAPQPAKQALPLPPTSSTCLAVAFGFMSLAAVVGGVLTASVGSGSDMALYVYGLQGWNRLVPDRAVPDYALTASSVVVMAVLSTVTAAARVVGAMGPVSHSVLLCWGATAWLVVAGAPLGTLLLTPAMADRVRLAFYLLAFTQFASFGIIDIRDDRTAWIAIGSITGLVVGWLGVSHACALCSKSHKLAAHDSLL